MSTFTTRHMTSGLEVQGPGVPNNYTIRGICNEGLKVIVISPELN